MTRLSPGATLGLLLAAAALLLVAGVFFARRTAWERQPRDRQPLQAFAGMVQQELQRLERLHEAHLGRIAREAPVHDRQAVWRLCDRVVGVGQFSFLQFGTDSDLHVPINAPGQVQWPEPVFASPAGGLPTQHVMVPRAELLEGASTSGWLDQPGQPLMYWLRRAPGACVVLMVDSADTAVTVDAWLREWLAAFSSGLGTGGATDQIESPTGGILARSGPITDTPADYAIPLRTRIGTWQIASWEPRILRVNYSVPAVTAAALLALILAGAGIFVSSQQRAALRAAEERVSFVNAVSHELRAPLTNILLNLEFAKDLLEGIHPAPDHRLISWKRKRAGSPG